MLKMYSVSMKITLSTKYLLTNQNLNFFRNLRSISRRGAGPKLIEGHVKTVTEYDESENIKSYKDFVTSVRKSKVGDELEIERSFLNEDYHGDVFERLEAYHDMHLKEGKQLKSMIKFKIIGRKYFKLDRETNLLTHAAKEQIKFLHKLNPMEWNYKALSECFPISEEGVKRLLKHNFSLTCPEKIKAHDQDVARKWEILKSGKFTDEISPVTQKLYREGKLVDDYFNGNLNLPTVQPPKKKVIELEKKKEIGEFSAIVQTYCDFEKQKLLQSKESSEKQVSLRNANDTEKCKTNNINLKKFRKLKPYDEEFDDDDAEPEVHPSRIKKYSDNSEISFSQFKELLTEEAKAKQKTKYKSDHDDFIIQEFSKESKNFSSKQPYASQNCFLKIPKYKKESVDLMYENSKKCSNVYRYDEKLGYQHPLGKSIKNQINIPSKNKKAKFHRVGQCVYDGNGEFLYKIPH